MRKLCYVATIPAVIHAFLREHIQAAAESYEVTVVCNSADAHLLAGLNARLIFMDIERQPSPLKDLRVLMQLFNLFRQERFDIVHSIMPKTGMLAMLAAKLARVPVRIHTFTGQVWVTRCGIRRALLKWFDKQIGSLANCALADSPSQRDFLVSEGVLSANKARVIADGSICGVDPVRFHPDPEAGRMVRRTAGIAPDALLILYVGRLNTDKGMLDLAKAFDRVATQYANVELLLVGAEEDVPFARMQELCASARNRLHYISFTATPELYMAAADIYCLPSYREGFGMTVIEAAACGVPAVATQIYGISDAVADGKTGLLFPAGDSIALANALAELITENGKRLRMGDAARERALALFSSKRVIGETVKMYGALTEKSPRRARQ